jgi:hypothetical protein
MHSGALAPFGGRARRPRRASSSLLASRPTPLPRLAGPTPRAGPAAPSPAPGLAALGLPAAGGPLKAWRGNAWLPKGPQAAGQALPPIVQLPRLARLNFPAPARPKAPADRAESPVAGPSRGHRPASLRRRPPGKARPAPAGGGFRDCPAQAQRASARAGRPTSRPKKRRPPRETSPGGRRSR